MSLKLSGDASDKQLQWLHAHNYYGTAKLTTQEADELISEIMAEERLFDKRPETLYYKRIYEINNQDGRNDPSETESKQ